MGKAAQLWLKSIAPASFFPDEILRPSYDRSSFRLGGIICTICLGVVERPLQLECDHLVRLTCCNWLEVSRFDAVSAYMRKMDHYGLSDF